MALVLLQARMRSTRLPGKVLLPLGGLRAIDWPLRRLAEVGPVVLCTSDAAADDGLAGSIRGPVTRGSENDVLGRFLGALEEHAAGEVIVRATGDNPLVLPELAAEAIDQLQRDGADYCSIEGSALGTTVEVLTREALVRVGAVAESAEEREHPTLGILRRPERFRITRCQAPAHYRSDLRLTLDTPADYAYLAALVQAIAKPPEAVTWRDICAHAQPRAEAAKQHLLDEVQRLKEHAWQP